MGHLFVNTQKHQKRVNHIYKRIRLKCFITKILFMKKGFLLLFLISSLLNSVNVENLE